MSKLFLVILSITMVLVSCKPSKNKDKSELTTTVNNKGQKVVQLYDLPPSTLENLGVDEAFLNSIGFTEDESSKIVKGGFKDFKPMAVKKGDSFLLKLKKYERVLPEFNNKENEPE